MSDIYPETKELRAMIGTPDDPQLQKLARSMVLYLGEYEHGTAEITDLHPDLNHEAVRLLLGDFFLFVKNI